MARRRRVGRPRVKGGPRKLTDKAIKAYMNRGVGRYIKSRRKKKKATKSSRARRRTSGNKSGRRKSGRGRGAPGRPKSPAHRKAIGRGVAKAWKRGAYKSRRKRRGGKRRSR